MKQYWTKFRTYDHYIFFISLLLMVVSPLFYRSNDLSLMAFDVTLIMAIISGMTVVASESRRKSLSLGVGFLALFGQLSSFWSHLNNQEALGWVMLTVVAFFFIITFALIRNILAFRYVGTELIVESMSGYLLLGINGAIAIGIASGLVEGGYNVNIAEEFGTYGFMYFSFVTLTTLGYGDILPVTSTTMALTVLISLAGVLYLAFLVATIVSKAAEPKEKAE